MKEVIIKQDKNGVTIDLSKCYLNAGEIQELEETTWEDLGYYKNKNYGKSNKKCIN